MLGAMLFNVAICRAANILVSDAFGEVSDAELLRANMEVGTFRTYDFAVGAVPFAQATPLVRGQLLLVSKKFPEASAMLDSVQADQLHRRDFPLLQISRAWSYANQARLDEAWSITSVAVKALSEGDDLDNLAYVYQRAKQISEMCSRVEAASTYDSLAQHCLSLHRAAQASTLELMLQTAQRIDGLPKKEGPAQAGP